MSTPTPGPGQCVVAYILGPEDGGVGIIQADLTGEPLSGRIVIRGTEYVRTSGVSKDGYPVYAADKR